MKTDPIRHRLLVFPTRKAFVYAMIPLMFGAFFILMYFTLTFPPFSSTFDYLASLSIVYFIFAITLFINEKSIQDQESLLLHVINQNDDLIREFVKLKEEINESRAT